jgi:hypothetical protein
MRAHLALAAVAVGVGGMLGLVPLDAAHANGAFPDGQSVLTPSAWEQEIFLATTFGVVFSQDAGKTWLWTCEQDANSLGYLYQMSASPRHRLFALAAPGLVYSDDGTCTWRLSGGLVTGAAKPEISDFWVDRALPDRVLAIGSRCCDPAGDRVYSLFESNDGGATFGAAIYVAPGGDAITGVETSISDPRTVYLTMSVGAAGKAALGLSRDGGATWQTKDLSHSLGAGGARLVAVAPDNPQRVFLLWNDPARGEELAVTDDAGETATIRLSGTGDGRVIRGFARSARGALLVATDRDGVGGLFRSTNGGQSFEELPHPPGLRGFSERGGTLYGATNNFGDGYALATSIDDGTSWAPLMSFDKVRAIPACLRTTCQDVCGMLAPTLWASEVCTNESPGGATAPGTTADGGTPARAATSGSGRGCEVGSSDAGDSVHGVARALSAVSVSVSVSIFAFAFALAPWVGATFLAIARSRRRRSPVVPPPDGGSPRSSQSRSAPSVVPWRARRRARTRRLPPP